MTSISPKEPTHIIFSFTILDLSNYKTHIKGNEQVETYVRKAFAPNCDTLVDKTIDAKNQLIQSVLRFRRDDDKILALCSILLKSRAYHLSSKSDGKAIIDIPRTKFKKPFLPEGGELSVSHQYPYVGIVLDTTNSKENGTLMGMDIVVMSETPHYCESEISFLECFKGSFTHYEWNRIMNYYNKGGSLTPMGDFYVRWAMKEAYTKALGVGMGLEFSSFEIRVVDGLWDEITRRKQLTIEGRIIHLKGKKEETWSFMFFHLSRYKDPSCACVAVGGTMNFSINMKWMELDDLIMWHQS